MMRVKRQGERCQNFPHQELFSGALAKMRPTFWDIGPHPIIRALGTWPGYRTIYSRAGRTEQSESAVEISPPPPRPRQVFPNILKGVWEILSSVLQNRSLVLHVSGVFGSPGGHNCTQCWLLKRHLAALISSVCVCVCVLEARSS